MHRELESVTIFIVLLPVILEDVPYFNQIISSVFLCYSQLIFPSLLEHFHQLKYILLSPMLKATKEGS
jgi:hypothetical protein